MDLSVEHNLDFVVLAMEDECKVEGFVPHLLGQAGRRELIAVSDPIDPVVNKTKLAFNFIANVSANSNISLSSSFV